MKRLEGMYENKGGLDKRINSSSIKRLLSNVNFCGVKRIKNTYAGVTKYKSNQIRASFHSENNKRFRF